MPVRPDGDPIQPDHPTQDRVEAIVARCLELRGPERAAALERALREHPGDADAIRACLRALDDSGFMQDEVPAPALEIPERLGGFRLLRRLGGGGMGEVFLAEQEPLRRTVALKLIRPECLFFKSSRERFQREVEVIARLQHPGIVPVFTVGDERGIPYFVMERIPGCTLMEALRAVAERAPERLTGQDLRDAIVRRMAEAAVPDRDAGDQGLFAGSWADMALRLVRHVAEALDHAHGRGVLHRDVKPSNIMVTPGGRVVLLDFGIASVEGARKITLAGSTLGSLDYMSPEQVLGDGEPDARTDVYSLGATLYELLTLRAPFASGSNKLTRQRILEGTPVPVRALNRTVAPDVQTVCLTAMDREPGRRYATAGAFARDMERVLRREPITARPPGLLLRARRWTQRHPAASVALLMGVLVGLGGPVGFALQRDAALREYTRLADVHLLAQMRQEEERLWPAVGAKLPEFDDWLRRADDLASRRALHERALAVQRARGTPGADGRAQFSAAADAWQHDVLEALVEQLREFEALVARVRARRALAASVDQLTVSGSEARAAWDAALHEILAGDESPYGHLELRPQLGLLPLGPDPRSRLWEFWHPETGSKPVWCDSCRKWEVREDSGLVFVLVPGGSFRMGSVLPTESRPAGRPLADPAHTLFEEPVHKVELVPFFLSKYEMTQGQWERVQHDNPAKLKGGAKVAGQAYGPRIPVDWVTWQACAQLVARLDLELPTEAQWEYACRAGTSSCYSFGDDRRDLPAYANVLEAPLWPPSGNLELETLVDRHLGSTNVGHFLANAFGLHDMHGNAAEWCRDHMASYQCAVRKGDGLREACNVRKVDGRIIRGGSCSMAAAWARSAARWCKPDDYKAGGLGLRPARPVR